MWEVRGTGLALLEMHFLAHKPTSPALMCLQPYLLLDRMVHDSSPTLSAGLPPAVPTWSLRLAVSYSRSSVGLAGQVVLDAAVAAANSSGSGADTAAVAEQWEPFLSALFLESCWRAVQLSWESSRCLGGPLQRYLGRTAAPAPEGTAEEEEEAAAQEQQAQLGAWLQLGCVPPLAQLLHAVEQVWGQAQRQGLGGLAGHEAAAAALASGFQMPLDVAQRLVGALLD